MNQTLLLNKLGLEVLTDSGWQLFEGLAVKGVKHTVTVQLENTSVTLTPDHHIFLETLEKISAESLKPGDMVCTLSGPQQVISVRENCLEKVYDLVNVGNNKRFYAPIANLLLPTRL